MHGLSVNIFRILSRMTSTLRFKSIKSRVAQSHPQLGIDLGCGPSPKNPFGVQKVIGIDLVATADEDVLGVDLSAEPIPTKSNSVQLVTAIDFLEHIPRWERTASGVRFPLVELFNEIFRVLEPGGFFFAETPVFPMSEVFQDPTHVNPMTTRTFSHYFAGPCWAQIYGFTGRFEVLEIGQNKGHLMTLMSADK